MTIFTPEEINLICIYDPGNRAGTIYELHDMMRYLMPDEADLKALAESAIAKLEGMTDAEYEELSEELTPPYSLVVDDEDSAWGAMPFGLFDDIDPDSEIE